VGDWGDALTRSLESWFPRLISEVGESAAGHLAVVGFRVAGVPSAYLLRPREDWVDPTWMKSTQSICDLQVELVPGSWQAATSRNATPAASRDPSRSFDDQVAWLAVHSDATAVSELMRISWRTVGWIVARVSRRLRRGKDALHGLRRIDKHFEAILNSLVHDLSNARIESLNTRIRLLTRRAFGFHSAAPLIGSFGRLQLALPGRA